MKAVVISIFILLGVTSTWGFQYGFDQDLASSLSAFSAIAYCRESDIKAWNCPACNATFMPREVYSAPNTKVSAYVIDNSYDATVVVFKGTDPLSWTQWASDFDFIPHEYCGKDCKVHGGFVKDFESLRDPIFKAAMDSFVNLPSSFKQIYVTGHSLGAATASLFAFYIRQQHQMQPVVYTLGAPRIGNQNWANLYNSLLPRAFRITHSCDIVPHLPPKGLFGFWHEGFQVFCDGNMGTSCRELAGAEDDGGILHISVQDHGIYMGINYFEYLDIGSQKACRFG